MPQINDTTDDLDDVELGTVHLGDGGYSSRGEDLVADAYEAALEQDGRVPVDEYVSVQAEGYAATVSVTVYVDDLGELEDALEEQFGESVESKVIDCGTGVEMIAEARDKLEGHLDADTIDTVIETIVEARTPDEVEERLNEHDIGRGEETDLHEIVIERTETDLGLGEPVISEVTAADVVGEVAQYVLPEVREKHVARVELHIEASSPYYG